MSVNQLASAVKNAVDKRIDEESRAKQGFIKGGRFQCGSKSYPFKQVVDCNLSGKVWAQLDKQSRAVIVGAS